MVRNICFVLACLIVLPAALAQEEPETPEKEAPAQEEPKAQDKETPAKKDEAFGHPGWPKLNEAEEVVEEPVEVHRVMG